MIEIKLPISASVSLLTEQMEREFEARQTIGSIDNTLAMADLSSAELKLIAEVAAFDLIMLLPVDLLIEESNLPQIIAKTIRTLGGIYDKADLNYYSDNDARRLLNIIKKRASIAHHEDQFMQN
jgi:hypothetical protein